MRCNVGKKEQIVRIVIALLIFAAGIVFRSWWGLVGFIPLFTALIRWCPLSALFGLNTCHHASSPTEANG